jgi:hypothetical protein
MFDSSVDFVPLRHISHVDGHPSAEIANLGGNHLQFLYIDVNQRKIGTVPRKPQRNAAADTLPGARDERHLRMNGHRISFVEI